jgi:hypothetical protein
VPFTLKGIYDSVTGAASWLAEKTDKNILYYSPGAHRFLSNVAKRSKDCFRTRTPKVHQAVTAIPHNIKKTCESADDDHNQQEIFNRILEINFKEYLLPLLVICATRGIALLPIYELFNLDPESNWPFVLADIPLSLLYIPLFLKAFTNSTFQAIAVLPQLPERIEKQKQRQQEKETGGFEMVQKPNEQEYFCPAECFKSKAKGNIALQIHFVFGSLTFLALRFILSYLPGSLQLIAKPLAVLLGIYWNSVVLLQYVAQSDICPAHQIQALAARKSEVLTLGISLEAAGLLLENVPPFLLGGMNIPGWPVVSRNLLQAFSLAYVQHHGFPKPTQKEFSAQENSIFKLPDPSLMSFRILVRLHELYGQRLKEFIKQEIKKLTKKKSAEPADVKVKRLQIVYEKHPFMVMSRRVTRLFLPEILYSLDNFLNSKHVRPTANTVIRTINEALHFVEEILTEWKKALARAQKALRGEYGGWTKRALSNLLFAVAKKLSLPKDLVKLVIAVAKRYNLIELLKDIQRQLAKRQPKEVAVMYDSFIDLRELTGYSRLKEAFAELTAPLPIYNLELQKKEADLLSPDRTKWEMPKIEEEGAATTTANLSELLQANYIPPHRAHPSTEEDTTEEQPSERVDHSSDTDSDDSFVIIPPQQTRIRNPS